MSERRIGQWMLAVPFLIFGVQHYVYASFVDTIVPAWIPWHRFWTLFCGTAIFATGLSLATNRYTALASALAGAMVASWLVLIHAPVIIHALVPSWNSSLIPPYDNPLNLADADLGGRLSNCFMDVGLSGALFICAGSLLPDTRVAALGRVMIGCAIWVFGILHFAFPAFAPGIPPMHESVAFPIPGHTFWVYASGTAFVVAGVCIVIDRETKRAAQAIGILILAFALITWVPVWLVKPIQITGGWLKPLGVAGGALMLAGVSDPARQPGTVAPPARPPHDGRRSPVAPG
jgi:uncharacterized membrane protein